MSVEQRGKRQHRLADFQKKVQPNVNIFSFLTRFIREKNEKRKKARRFLKENGTKMWVVFLGFGYDQGQNFIGHSNFWSEIKVKKSFQKFLEIVRKSGNVHCTVKNFIGVHPTLMGHNFVLNNKKMRISMKFFQRYVGHQRQCIGKKTRFQTDFQHFSIKGVNFVKAVAENFLCSTTISIGYG